jgi:hypothetical protein
MRIATGTFPRCSPDLPKCGATKQPTLGCSSCDRSHEYILFGDRVALYTDDERALDDFKARTPSTADGFVVPADESEVSDRGAAALLSLAERAASTEPAVLLRNLLGHFVCGNCGQEQSIRAV